MQTGASVSRLTSLARKLLPPAAFATATAAAAYHCSEFTVPPGHRAVILSRFKGVGETSLGEGTHFAIPWIQKPYIIDVRDKQHTFSCASHTKDLHPVNLSLRIALRPELSNLPETFKHFGLDYDERVLPVICSEVHTIIANYNVERLLTENNSVLDDIHGSLVRRGKSFHVVVDGISIVDISLSEELSKAVEQKKLARQEAEMSNDILIKAEHEKDVAIRKAEEELQAAKQVAELPADVHEQLLDLMRMEAEREIIKARAKFENVASLARSEAKEEDTCNPSSENVASLARSEAKEEDTCNPSS
ncbi:Prohibitin-3, mitochondrial [Linum perenne]